MTDPDDTGPSDPMASADEAESTTRRRIVAGYVGGVALLVVAALLAWWALANTSTEPTATTSPGSVSPAASASESMEETEDPTVSATDPAHETPDGGSDPSVPGVTAPMIEAFSPATSEAVCPSDRSSEVPIDFSWRTSGAEEAWIAVGTTDASALPFAKVPVAVDSYVDLTFTCLEEEQLYTLTVRGAGGTTSTSVVVTRVMQ